MAEDNRLLDRPQQQGQICHLFHSDYCVAAPARNILHSHVTLGSTSIGAKPNLYCEAIEPFTKPPLLQESRLTGGGSPNLVGLVEWKVPVERFMGAANSVH